MRIRRAARRIRRYATHRAQSVVLSLFECSRPRDDNGDRILIAFSFSFCYVSAMHSSCCHLSPSSMLFFSSSYSPANVVFNSFRLSDLCACQKNVVMLIFTWIGQLVWAVTAFNLRIFWGSLIWTIGIITLPFRALGALHREKVTATHFEQLQIEIENLLWTHRMLEAQFSLAIKERKLLESMLSELEGHHEKAIAKIEHLEKQVRNLRTENLELREFRGKAYEDGTNRGDTKQAQTQTLAPRKASSNKGTSTTFEGVLTKTHEPTRATPSPTGLTDPLTPLVFSNIIDPEAALYQRRDVALSQSLFSGLLSLLVGTIAYEAKDPCMPLVIALFIVVGMSLKSVVHFFSTIRHKPAGDAVALLCFNWFILGTLTYPTLPMLAQWLSPVASSVMGRTLGWVGLGSLVP